MTPKTLSFFSLGISLLALLLSFFKYNFTKKMESFNTLLEMESQLDSRKIELDKLSKNIEIAEKDGDCKTLEILINYYDTGKENYYNRLDRLASGILKNYLREKELEKEYRNYIFNVIKEDPESFNEASPYKNIKKLNRKWQ